MKMKIADASTLAPILTTFARSVLSDQCSTSFGNANVSSGSRLCQNSGCFVCVAGLWVWMICRDGFCGFVDWFGSRGLVGGILPF